MCDSFATPSTVACQASMHGIFRQEHWSMLPFPSAGDLPDSGIKTMSPSLANGFITSESQRSPQLPLMITEVDKGRGKKKDFRVHFADNTD